jgi:hypothetical protein
MMKKVTYHGITEHFAKQARKNEKIILKNLKITTAIDGNVTNIIQSNKIWLGRTKSCVKSNRLRSNERQKDFSNNSLAEYQPFILLATFYHQIQNIHICKMQYYLIYQKQIPFFTIKTICLCNFNGSQLSSNFSTTCI